MHLIINGRDYRHLPSLDSREKAQDIARHPIEYGLLVPVAASSHRSSSLAGVSEAFLLVFQYPRARQCGRASEAAPAGELPREAPVLHGPTDQDA